MRLADFMTHESPSGSPRMKAGEPLLIPSCVSRLPPIGLYATLSCLRISLGTSSHMTHRAFSPLKSRSTPTMTSTQSRHQSLGPFLNALMTSYCSLRASTSTLSSSAWGQESPVPVGLFSPVVL